ncbi:MAG: 2-hydroxyacid dehydrogenase [Mycoplasmoidaceae bacterium]|nr:2-hydroxyacid dehydrogenase [Mycoplasmoidaceae bacterium]
MKILFYDAKDYDKKSFDKHLKKNNKIKITYFDGAFDCHTARLAKGYKAICIFVNAEVDAKCIKKLKEAGVKLILLRCAGFNNVDLKACNLAGITVMRVPSYSPESIAEMAMALALAVNRKLHKAYFKVLQNNFALDGLLGMDFYKKTAGIVGTGKIGAAMARICHGFGMKVLAYDKYKNSDLDFAEYVDLKTLLKQSDLISLHCPLTPETHHLIKKETIDLMKDNVVLVNTSRGGLIKTCDLIKGIRSKKFFGVGLDVYEEEGKYVYENLENSILDQSTVARLLSFPNVVITSHQAFFTIEALDSIAQQTIDNAISFVDKKPIEQNIVK